MKQTPIQQTRTADISAKQGSCDLTEENLKIITGGQTSELLYKQPVRTLHRARCTASSAQTREFTGSHQGWGSQSKYLKRRNTHARTCSKERYSLSLYVSRWSEAEAATGSASLTRPESIAPASSQTCNIPTSSRWPGYVPDAQHRRPWISIARMDA